MTFILAKIFGLYFLGVGVACLLNPKHFRQIYKQMLKNEDGLFIGEIIALLFGAFVVSVHNIWVMDWPVIITILGWWSWIKGVALMGYSKFGNIFSFMLQKSNAFYRGLGAFMTLLGLFFLYQGWF